MEENHGCRGMFQIFVRVIDANGNPLDGVEVGRVLYNSKKMSGSKDSGPQGIPERGWLQFDLYSSGDKVYVSRDVDGRDVSNLSQVSDVLDVREENIPPQVLVDAGYCSSVAECQDLVSRNDLCQNHHSYEVVFQRTW